jgi:hypothetical protein
MSNHLTQTIIKLKERGVISKAHAKTMLKLALFLESPAGKAASKELRYMAVNAIVEIIHNSLGGR